MCKYVLCLLVEDVLLHFRSLYRSTTAGVHSPAELLRGHPHQTIFSLLHPSSPTSSPISSSCFTLESSVWAWVNSCYALWVSDVVLRRHSHPLCEVRLATGILTYTTTSCRSIILLLCLQTVPLQLRRPLLFLRCRPGWVLFLFQLCSCQSSGRGRSCRCRWVIPTSPPWPQRPAPCSGWHRSSAVGRPCHQLSRT